MIEQGRDDLTDEFRREGLPVQKIWNSERSPRSIVEHSYTDVDTFLAAIGEHHVSARGVAQRLARAFRAVTPPSSCPATVLEPRRRPRRRRPEPVGVHVEGLDDLMVRLANCCTPVPGDEIIGFVTRGRGVSVHRADCANATSLADEQATRMIEVEWDGDGGQEHVRRRRRGRGARPVAAAARRRQRARRPGRQHPLVRDAHR